MNFNKSCDEPPVCQQNCINIGKCKYQTNGKLGWICSYKSPKTISSVNLVQKEPCSSSDVCMNGGTCKKEENVLGFVCSCKNGYYGGRCEIGKYQTTSQ
jgi:hypothetical protein